MEKEIQNWHLIQSGVKFSIVTKNKKKDLAERVTSSYGCMSNMVIKRILMTSFMTELRQNGLCALFFPPSLLLFCKLTSMIIEYILILF